MRRRKNERVVMSPAGALEQIVLPSIVASPWINDIAVDEAGNVYATVFTDDHVLMYAAASREQFFLPFTESYTDPTPDPDGVAVGSAGDVYVVESSYEGRVLLLPRRR